MKIPAEIQALVVWLRARAVRGEERGASIVEWVIIVAVLAGLAIAVGAIIVSKVTAKANGINLGG
jgi:Flp pilus assembly pilin Flp